MTGSSGVLLETNLVRRNNFEQLTGYYPAAVKICGGELQALRRGLEENVRQHRDRRTTLDDPLHRTQFCEEEVTPKA